MQLERVDEQHDRRAVQRRRRARREALRQARPRAGRLFAGRAAQVRDIGVTTAMYSRVLFVALGFVAAVGTAVVYYLGGRLVIDGRISIGTLACVRHLRRPDLPAAHAAHERPRRRDDRAGVVRARLRGARLPGPDHRAARRHRPRRPGSGKIELDHVWFRHPPGRHLVDPVPRGGGVAADDDADPSDVDPARRHRSPSSPASWSRSSVRRGRGRPRPRCSCPASHDVDRGRGARSTVTTCATLTLDSLREAVGMVMQDPHLFHETIAENLRYAKPDATGDELVDGVQGGADPRSHREPPRRVRHGRR